jgi:hypothetical protein
MSALTSDLTGIGLTAQQAKMLGDTQHNSITANGLTQGTATALNGSINHVTVVTATNNGVILPLAVSTPYSVIIVRNSDGADTLNIWPAVGDSINSLVNTPIAAAAGVGRVLAKISSTGWISI